MAKALDTISLHWQCVCCVGLGCCFDLHHWMVSLPQMTLLEGSIAVSGTFAYVAQQAWILNATLRDNILFGKEFDEER